jgi:hypothetical protein
MDTVNTIIGIIIFLVITALFAGFVYQINKDFNDWR